jgi:AraC-like DNA-binding protein
VLSPPPAACQGVGRLLAAPGWAAARHAHAYAELIVTVGGALDIALGDAAHRLDAGGVLCYPPDLPHAERTVGEQPAEFYFIAFTGGGIAPRQPVADAGGRLRVLARWLYDEQASLRTAKAATLDAFLAAFLAELAQATTRSGFGEAVRAYLRARLAEPLTVAEVAAHMAMSRAHFIRCYKRHTGRTPMAELRLLRVEAARDLLLTTDLPLRAIAPRVGFYDEHHLSRVFRQCLHVPPGYFRRRG